jgi:hypothetical protein
LGFRGRKQQGTGEKCIVRNLMILYSSINTMCVSKLKNKNRAGHVELTGQTALHTGFFGGSLKATDHLEGLDVDGRIILNIYCKRERICRCKLYVKVGDN